MNAALQNTFSATGAASSATSVTTKANFTSFSLGPRKDFRTRGGTRKTAAANGQPRPLKLSGCLRGKGCSFFCCSSASIFHNGHIYRFVVGNAVRINRKFMHR